MRCTAALLELRGPRAEWPWFYDARTGRVVDMYPVYSIHQDGMAPAFLHHAVAHGLPGAREAIMDGFRWILGQNQLGRPMVVRQSGLINRAQIRREGMQHARRAIRSIVRAVSRRPGRLADTGSVEVLPECWSYHLGWMLWSFAGREDYRELTHDPAFDTPLEA